MINIFCDNVIVYNGFKAILESSNENFSVYCSYTSEPMLAEGATPYDLKKFNKNDFPENKLFLSCHSKQIFPLEMLEYGRSINIHPGYLPNNRGWYPQVFAIQNGLETGVTVHEMTVEIDDGPIIYREKIPIEFNDTSKSIYDRVILREIEIFAELYEKIIDGSYETELDLESGNFFTRRDFEDGKLINLDRRGTFGEFYNYLRSMTHEPFQNSYIIKDGKKFFISISITEAIESDA